jgi:imidazolonepropionase-like amidohydrolase
MLSPLLKTIALAIAPLQGDADAQDGTFLIENVRVWQQGEVVGPMDMLVQDGWILGMVPADGELTPNGEFTRIEAAEDWVVYPGLIHANYKGSFLAEPQNPYVHDSSDPRTGPVPAMEYGDRRQMRGWSHVADYLDWDADGADGWRDAGFTAGQVIPRSGVVRGRAAVVSLNGLPLGEALLKRDGHQVLGLSSRGGYPGTAMGVMAYLRQVLIDSARVNSGDLRRSNDPDFSKLGPAIFVADGRRQIENVLDLLEEFAPELPVVILGGSEAWLFSDRLKARNVAVLYEADFGEAMESEEDLEVKGGEERPYWQEPAGIRAAKRLRHQEWVAGFQQLQQSGVRCALVPPRETGDWSDAFQQLVDGGMTAEQVWTSASTDVAAILGLMDAGSIRGGGGADFVIVRGELGAEAEMAWVFADGRGWEFELEEDSGEEGEDGGSEKGEGGKAAAGADLDGGWQITVQTPMGEQEFVIVVDREANTIDVTDALGNESEPAKGVGFKDDRLKMTYFVEEMEMEFTMFAKVSGDSMTGKLDTEFGPVPLTGERLSGGGGGGDESVAKADDEGEQGEGEEGEEGEEEDVGVATGHPEWLVETQESRAAANPFAGDVLIQGGTIYSMDGREPFVGDVLIVGGKITAISEGAGSIQSPGNTPVYNADGKHVVPAMIDAHSHLALASVNEGSMAITAECRIADMLMARNHGIYRAAAGGTAMAQSLHGSANPIGGQAAVWEMDYYANSIDGLIYDRAPQGIKFALGENVKQSNWDRSGSRFPNTRMGVQAVYRRAFTAAQDYKLRRDLHAQGKLQTFRRDVRLEVLADIIDNIIHIQCHSYRADELLMFIGVCEEFGIKNPTFQHVLEGYKVAPELAEYGAMGSSFADWWAYKIEAYDAIPWNPGLMHDAGMVASINSDSDDLIRRLNTEAGKSVRYGEYPWQVALSFATLNVAKQLRIDEFVGSIEVGKDGTIAVYDAPPLSTYARCHLTLARGRTLFEWKVDNEATWQAYRDAVAEFAGKTRARAEKLAAAEAAAEAGSAAAASESAADGADGIATAKDGGDGAEDSNEGVAENATAEAMADWTKLGQGQSYLISNARIHSMVGEAYKGWVLVENGLITKTDGGDFRGRKPAGAVEIDARGMNLYPGFINGSDVTGLYEIGSVGGTLDTRETGQDHPDLSVASSIHADSAHHRVTRLNGITHVLVRPSRGRIRGQAALIQLAGDTTEEMIVQQDLGLVIAFPRASAPELGQLGRAFELSDHDCDTAGVIKYSIGEPEQGLQPREGVEMPENVGELDDWFDDALDYGDRADVLAERGEQFLERDLKMEALLPYARGEKPVLIEANDAITIMAARAWAQDRGLDVIYLGAKEAWKVAGYLGADQARVVLGSVHDLPPRIRDPYDSIYRAASVLKAAGCQVALRTNNPEVTRNLPFQAATAAAWGLGRDEALRALTLGAAEILGVDAYTGSIEAGKSANFFLCSGDPLDFTGQIRRMWIGGREVEMSSRQTKLRDRFAERIEKMKN